MTERFSTILKKLTIILKKNLISKDKEDSVNIEVEKHFSEYRFNKKSFIKNCFNQLHIQLNPQIFWEYPTLEELAVYIAEQEGIKTKSISHTIKHEHLQKQQPIAIIGMGCRFPGKVNNCQQFWELLTSGLDPIEDIPLSRWNIEEFYAEDYHKPGKMNTRKGGFLEDIDRFDPAFFNISPKEAVQMDPQQRLFLEVAWQAIEHANLEPTKLSYTSTGVFVGVSMHDYERLIAKYGSHELIDAYSNLGAAFSAVGARLSYFLGLNGPSFAIDTACSSSISALYHACQSLRIGDCDMALSGGVNLILDPDPTISYSQAHMMAPDGHCKTFDEKANGYVRSEGCGIVILKRLEDALRDGDTICAVIRSVVANQDGASNGLTAPNMHAQKTLLEDGLYCANLSPDQIDFFEAHGTGTYIGDPIEVDAINQVYTTQKREKPLYLGALKSQIGHCEAAAGIASVIKVTLAMQHQIIPANLHFDKLNPAIDINKVPCQIPTEMMPWVTKDLRRAALSSYGFTGTNTHTILEEAPAQSVLDDSIKLPKEHLFVLSAKNKQSLSQLIEQYIAYLETSAENIENICYTAAVGRRHFNFRIAILCKNKQDLIKKLKNKSLEIIEVIQTHKIIKSIKVSAIYDAYLLGHQIDWSSYYKPYIKALKKVQLPTYCFDKKSYWINFNKRKALPFGDTLHELLGVKLPGYSAETRFINQFNLKEIAYLSEHQLFGYIVLPGAAFIESIIAASHNACTEGPFEIKQMNFMAPLVLDLHKIHDYQVSLQEQNKEFNGVIYSRSSVENEWIRHVEFVIKTPLKADYSLIDIEKIRQSMQSVKLSDLYNNFKKIGLDYGHSFQTIRSIFRNNESLLLELESNSDSVTGYYVHPALLDGVFQAAMLLSNKALTKAYIPFKLSHIKWYGLANNKVYAHLTLRELNSEYLVMDAQLVDEHGVILMTLEGYQARSIEKNNFEKLINKDILIDSYIEDFEVYSLPETIEQSKHTPFIQANKNNFKKLAKVLESFELKPIDKDETAVFEKQHAVFVYEDNFDDLVDFAKHSLTAYPLSLTLIVNNAFNLNTDVSPSHRLALGFWRAFALEDSKLPCYLIDCQDLKQTKDLLNLIFNKVDLPRELIIRDKVYAPKLRALSTYQQQHKRLSTPLKNHYLNSSQGIDTLFWQTQDEQTLNGNQIRLKIQATALNFRDVLKAMDLYPGDAGKFGYECAGIISEIGAEVKQFKVGDKVIALALNEGLFGEEVVLQENQIVALPPHLSTIEGASIPLVFVTAYEALIKLAKLKKGQKILIHAATGGLGLAAIQFAKLQGAEIYATTSQAKQQFLKEELDIKYVYDSRTTVFGEEILNDTKGRGVDVILNSLTGEGFIESSLKCLKKTGIFLEVSKLNIYSPAQMKKEHPQVTYHIIELDESMRDKPEQVQHDLKTILNLFAENKLKPLPIQEFRIDQAIEAFHYLQQAKHIGKVVITNPSAALYDAQATYLITGGTGGLGLELAKHLIAKGVKHIALTSSKKASITLIDWIKAQENAGVIITHHQANVADKAAMQKVIKAIHTKEHPLKGIFHAAGIIQDGMLVNLKQADFDRVLAPKVEGSQYLHELTKDISLDHFVLFSSIVSALGNFGQTNYAAANAFMDGLCQLRHQHGLPALSIHWGAFANVGMAANLASFHKTLGWIPHEPRVAFNTMDLMLSLPYPNVMLAKIDWQKISVANTFYLSEITTKQAKTYDWKELLANASPDKRKQLLSNKLKTILADILNSKELATIDVKKGFFEQGMDSLMAVDFKNQIQQLLGKEITLTNTVAFDYNNIDVLSDYLLGQLDFKRKEIIAETSQPAIENEDIAIIGMSCEFPGAKDISEFWQLLIEGREAIREVPKQRFDIDYYYDPDPKAPGKMITRRAGFIDDIDLFDNEFFAISAKEAEYLDPQQRLLLVHVWKALEHAGIDPQSLRGSDMGVFIGILTSEYRTLIEQNGAENINAYVGTGNSLSTASGRISYTFGLQGPNLAIDTACSSSLVALNEACERLQSGECSSAIVGGVNALLTPDVFINFSKAGMLAPDGRCKTFDEKANGYVRGEGCGILILKRLSNAQKDNDPILAVIKASSINQDGASSGLTVPNGVAQERLLNQTLKLAKLTPQDIDYVECHGTGTSLGDPIEVHALGQTYGKERQHPLLLGSVKTNIGHLESAAGVAGLIKLILALNHQQIPKHLNFTQLNSHISLNFPAEIVTENKAWVRGDKPRYAAISSFGFSGTNAHVILEEAPMLVRETIDLPREHIFVLSAKTRSSLEHLIQTYQEYLANTTESLADICYTAAIGRSHFNYRIAFKVESIHDLINALDHAVLSEVELSDDVVSPSTADELLASYLVGRRIDWQSYYQPYSKALSKIALPTYRFDRKKYWLVSKATKSLPFGETVHELLGAKLPGFSEETRFINRLTLNELHYLSEHQVFNHVIFPAAAFIESALSSQALFEQVPLLLQDISFLAPLELSASKGIDYQIRLLGSQGTIHSQQPNNWVEHVRFMVGPAVNRQEMIDLEALKASMLPMRLDDFYPSYETLGLNYGLAFQTIREAYRQDQMVLVNVKAQAGISTKQYKIHPTLLDGIFQALALLTEHKKTFIPSSIKQLDYVNQAGNELWAHLTLLNQQQDAVTLDIKLYDADGILVATIAGFVARAVERQAFEKLLAYDKAIGEYVERYEHYDLPPVSHNDADDILVYGSVTAFKALALKSAQHAKANGAQELTQKAVAFIYEENLDALIALAKRLAAAKPSTFTLIIKQGFALNGQEEVNPTHSAMIGFFRSFKQENINLPCYLLDAIDLKDTHSVLNAISQQVLVENQIIVRDTLYVPRLVTREAYHKANQRLTIPAHNEYLISGQGIDTLAWSERKLSALTAHQVKLTIKATALNFRDILKAMHLYPGEAGDFGYECAGIVAAIGEKVKDYQVGDRVVAFGQGLFGGEVIVEESQVVKLPKALTFAQGASLPIVFLTANYGLNHLAHLKKGQKVLIHAATGGVGLAAIELAKLKGAEIYATASKSKQEYLKKLGIKHSYDSRTTDFAQQILNDTNQQGVDVILNSLTSEGFIEASLSCLKKKGTFLEIGKLNIYTQEHMRKVRADVAYHIIAIDERIAKEPQVIQDELKAIMALFEQGKLQALPLTEYPITKAIDAFHYVQQAKHIGKVILTNPQAFTFKPEATYLITGGTGGLGLALAKYLIEQGVRHLALTSRHALSEETKQWIRKQHNIEINHYAVDVSDKQALSQVFDRILQNPYPLKGIFHAAGVLKDGVLTNLTRADFEQVLAPKVKGSQNLHELSQNLELDCFVLFSSIASSLGHAGQTNYATANAYMDGLAHYRQQQSLPALSINFGPFAKVGMAAHLHSQHQAQGLHALSAQAAFVSMRDLLNKGEAQVTVADINWSKVSYQDNPYISQLVSKTPKSQSDWANLLENTPPEKRSALLASKLKTLLAEILNSADAASIDVKKGFFDLGMDSLMAVDFKNKIQQWVGKEANLTNTLAFDYNNITVLTDYLLEQLAFKVKKETPQLVQISHEEADIAIIGLSCEFPGAANEEAFWDLLSQGKEGITEIPKTRFDVDSYYDPDPKVAGKIITRRAGFIRDIDQFDNQFFTISPKEAEYLDPQQRLLLTHTWQALEHAGINPATLEGSDTGVFVGICTSDYGNMIQKYGTGEQINAYLGTGNFASTASGRISYTLGLQGPNMAIDTACSSSLVALNEACERLQRSECSLAIVGGVNALLAPDLFINFSKAGMLAPDGRCKTFDESANGYVRGEGCGVVIVKRLSDAQRDNDTVLAVIKASGINQDGASSGLTVPNGQAQERLLTRVLAKAQLKPEDIDYVECHGTGTSLGDPIEAHALGQVYGKERDKPLLLGSVKTNIGHLEAAAGVAGLIKVVLALNHQLIPKHLNFKQLNSHISLNVPAEIVTDHKAWLKTNKLRHAAVSSFGFSGTNAHVILEEAPEVVKEAIKLPRDYVFVLSAKTNTSLKNLIKAYQHYLAITHDELANICYTAAVGRNHFNYRIALKASTKEELSQALNEVTITDVQTRDEVITSHAINEVITHYLAGKTIDWQSYYQPYVDALRKVALPTYNFDKKRYWLNIKSHKKLPFGETIHELLGAKLPGFSAEKRFINSLDIKELLYLKEHQVFEHILFPGAAFVESALIACLNSNKQKTVILQEFNLLSPLELNEKALKNYQVSLVGHQGTIHSQYADDEWVEHAQFKFDKNNQLIHEVVDLESLKASMLSLALNDFYSNFEKIGLQYGKAFQTVKQAYKGNNEVLIFVEVNEQINTKDYLIHPTLLDGVFQAMYLFVENQTTFIPSSIKQFQYLNQAGHKLWARLTLVNQSPTVLTVKAKLYNPQGILVAIIEDFVARAVKRQILEKGLNRNEVIDEYLEHYERYELPQVLNTAGNDIVVYSSIQNFNALAFDKASHAKPNGEQNLTNKAVVFIYENNLEFLVYLAQQLITARPASFTLVINNGFAVTADTVVNPAHSQVIGFFRCFKQENQALPCYLVDTRDLQETSSVLTLISQQALAEHQLIVHDQIFVPRLVSMAAYNQDHHRLSVPTANQYLISGQGIDTLTWGERILPDMLSEFQVKFTIEATALNFRDILKAMHLYPGEAGDFGYECAGIVTAVGDKVSTVTVGDRIVVFSAGLLAAEALTDENHIVRLPSNLTCAQGASLPIVFLTANYALNGLAKIKKGDKVLIHAAAGGVGLAAIELAKLKGAEIYATASEAKQAYLKELGIKHIYDSRSTTFSKQILEDTQDEGVDVILNSLTSEGFIEASLSCLKEKGIFLEIGKLNIYTQAQMQHVRPDVTYHIIAIDERIAQEPHIVRTELETIMTLFEQGQLNPLPVTEYPVTQVIDAFYYVQQAKHMGKVVITKPQDFRYDANATYLITGGTGGLGLELAQYLIGQGVRHLALTSRSMLNEELASWIADQHEVKIDHYAVDVADKEALSAVFASINKKSHPLKGIFHAAGVLKDGLLPNLTEADFRAVLAPKVKGAQNLHELSQHLALDCFVLFSSIASSIGNPGQSNYATANAYMDGLAHHRRHQGLPALSINFGPFAKVGMAANLESQHQAQGIYALSTDMAFSQMQQLLNQNYAQVTLVQADWEKLSRPNDTYLSSLMTTSEQPLGDWVTLLEATNEEKHDEVLSEEIRQILAEVLHIPNSEPVSITRGFFDLGMDSLMAVDFKNKIQQKLGTALQLNNTVAFDYNNIQVLSKYIIAGLGYNLSKNTVVDQEEQIEDIINMTSLDKRALAEKFLDDDFGD